MKLPRYQIAVVRAIALGAFSIDKISINTDFPIGITPEHIPNTILPIIA